MIELVLTLMYVGLSALILCRWWRSRDALNAPGINNQTCDVNETKKVRLGRLRCKLRMLVELEKTRRERDQR